MDEEVTALGITPMAAWMGFGDMGGLLGLTIMEGGLTAAMPPCLACNELFILVRNSMWRSMQRILFSIAA